MKDKRITYRSKRPHLSDSLETDLVWNIVEVKDELRKLTAVMTLPLADILKVVAFDSLRAICALQLLVLVL